MNKIIFGPVASRRLGMSLGIDLIPLKTCSLNCIYCECGATTNHTIERKEYYPFSMVIDALDDALKSSPELDYVTFAGSGEPMLHSRFGDIVDHIKMNYPQYKICLLTNSTLFTNAEVRKEAMKVDMVVPSLDAATELAFKKININLPENPLSEIIDGIISFSNEYSGILNLEVFIVPGINDSELEVNAIVEVAKKVKPNSIQLNSLDRPGVSKSIVQATPSSLKEIAKAFYPLDVQIASRFNSQIPNFEVKDLESLILDTTYRRPCTQDDFVDITGLAVEIIEAKLGQLLSDGKLSTYSELRGTFYTSRK